MKEPSTLNITPIPRVSWFIVSPTFTALISLIDATTCPTSPALRTFLEYIAVKIYLTGKTETVNYDNKTVRIALDDIKCRGNID